MCKELEISSVPYTKRGSLTYRVPVNGGVSMWFTDAVTIPPDEGSHYNWDLPTSELIGIAEVGIMLQLNYSSFDFELQKALLRAHLQHYSNT